MQLCENYKDDFKGGHCYKQFLRYNFYCFTVDSYNCKAYNVVIFIEIKD